MKYKQEYGYYIGIDVEGNQAICLNFYSDELKIFQFLTLNEKFTSSKNVAIIINKLCSIKGHWQIQALSVFGAYSWQPFCKFLYLLGKKEYQQLLLTTILTFRG